jgi:hypothetical protein
MSHIKAFTGPHHLDPSPLFLRQALQQEGTAIFSVIILLLQLQYVKFAYFYFYVVCQGGC